MISGLIDELRELAGDGSMEWVSGPIRASVLREAADTIWQLRDDLQRANAENAKLRELGKQYELVIVDYRAEVAKLRELVRDMWQELDAIVPYDPYDHDGLDEYRDRMRELGIEVGVDE